MPLRRWIRQNGGQKIRMPICRPGHRPLNERSADGRACWYNARMGNQRFGLQCGAHKVSAK